MGKENYLKYYLNQPIETSIGKPLYCILLKDWDNYISIAGKYLTICDLLLRRRLELPEEVKLFDYVILVAIHENEIEKLEEMFSLAFRQPVKCFAMFKQGKIDVESTFFAVGDLDKKDCIINRDNYEEIREIMKEQALLHDPLIAKNERSQKVIDKAIEKKAKSGSNGKKSSIEAMLVMNSTTFPVDLETYTYYQLRAQYEILDRKENALAIHIYRSQGAKVDPIMLNEELSIHDNPYSFEKLFRVDNKQLGG